MKIWIFAVFAATGVASAGSQAFAQAEPVADKAPTSKVPAAKTPAAAAAAPAAGGEAKDAKAPSAAELAGAVTKGQPAKPRIIDFEDETIRGTLTKPEGDLIDARKRGKQKSLIKIRPHFVPELLKSADDL